MKKIVGILFFITMALTSQCQSSDIAEIRRAIVQQLNNYPKSTLQDIYKSFYQEHFGPEHLINDTASVRQYLLYELTQTGNDGLYYEPIGCNGEYIRVHLNSVTDSLITADDLLDAFIASANAHRQPSSDWNEKWNNIINAIQTNNIEIEGFDKAPILLEAAQKQQAVHHSQRYNEAYHPHYRIVEREIFESRLKPLIDKE